jgi:hypothetical protein
MASELRDKRYIGLLRCSTVGQADTSIDDQRRLLDAFAREHGLVAADYVALEGVSGSLPGNRTDIQKLIVRKQARDDFDILLVQDTSRFTRAGTQHAHRLESELNAAGIEVVYATGAIPPGDVGDLVKSIYAYSDQHHARAISFVATRGAMSSILDGRSPYCRRPPFGIDRLYVAADGTPSHIIRNLPDGGQLKLSPDCQTVLARFERNERRGGRNHYNKQRQERIILVPGDEARLAAVRQIYRRHYVDGWGTHRIAEELNVAGVPSAEGGRWSTTVLLDILGNPIYLGRGIANRCTRAIYHMRGPDRPVEAKLDKRELYQRRRPPAHARPQSDWVVQDYPALFDILPPEIRDLAAAKQQAHLDAQAAGERRKPNRDRHRDSSFFLKGILRSKQGDEPMTGTTTGKRGIRKRYYRVPRAHAYPNGNRVLRRLIPAEPIERAVIEIVRRTLLTLPDLRDRIERKVRAALKAATDDAGQLKELTAEREAIRRKLEFVVDSFDAEMKELAERKIGELRAQLRAINDRIARCRPAVALTDSQVAERVDAVVAAIENLAQALGTAPPPTLAGLLQTIVGRLVVDLETREGELEIALPAEADPAMWLDAGSACKSCNEPHPRPRAIVAAFTAKWDRSARKYGHPQPTTLGAVA